MAGGTGYWDSNGDYINGGIQRTQVTGSSMELYGLSTDTKPTTGLVVGTSFFEIDTTNAYMWDGSTWRLI